MPRKRLNLHSLVGIPKDPKRSLRIQKKKTKTKNKKKKKKRGGKKILKRSRVNPFLSSIIGALFSDWLSSGEYLLERGRNEEGKKTKKILKN